MMKTYLPLISHRSLLGLVTLLCLLFTQTALGGKFGGTEVMHLDGIHGPFPVDLNGTVKDANGEPLIGVNILVKGTNKGTTTEFDGNFTIEGVEESAVLIVSYIGFQTVEIEVG